PLRDLADQLGAAPSTAFFQIAGNLLVFAAFGFFAAARWRIGLPAIVAIAAAGSVTVEALQYGLALGRVSSVDDVLLNGAGAGIAALAYRRWRGAEPAGAEGPASRFR
ncbi:MAG TPA: VanZ family protein, partial [Pilimelia sp.]|nr:VanZ family protein [Pilimelia sp.]